MNENLEPKDKKNSIRGSRTDNLRDIITKIKVEDAELLKRLADN